MESRENVTSFENELQFFQDFYEGQEMEVTAIENPAHQTFPVAAPVILMQDMQVPLIGGPGRGVKRKHYDSGNISLSSGSSDDPYLKDVMQGVDESVPLPDLEISSSDFKENENPIHYPVYNDLTQPMHQQGMPSTRSSQFQNDPTLPTILLPAMNPDSSGNGNISAMDGGTVITIPPDNGIPPACEIRLTVGYLSSRCIVQMPISHVDGFLLYHEKIPQPSQLPADCKFIRFPDVLSMEDAEARTVPGVEGHSKKLTIKDQKYVQAIINNMQGGLQIRSHNGCIYATRRSKAKIFYKSHDTDGEAARACTISELPRNQEQMVFNGLQYRSEVSASYFAAKHVDERTFAEKMDPTIYFTFAQKWTPEYTPLKTCLVWAKLEPCQALHTWDGLLHPQHRSLGSFSSGMLQFSSGEP